MDVTEDLTNKARGSNKSFLAAANGEASPQWECSKAWRWPSSCFDACFDSLIVSLQGS